MIILIPNLNWLQTIIFKQAFSSVTTLQGIAEKVKGKNAKIMDTHDKKEK